MTLLLQFVSSTRARIQCLSQAATAASALHIFVFLCVLDVATGPDTQHNLCCGMPVCLLRVCRLRSRLAMLPPTSGRHHPTGQGSSRMSGSSGEWVRGWVGFVWERACVGLHAWLVCACFLNDDYRLLTASAAASGYTALWLCVVMCVCHATGVWQQGLLLWIRSIQVLFAVAIVSHCCLLCSALAVPVRRVRALAATQCLASATRCCCIAACSGPLGACWCTQWK